MLPERLSNYICSLRPHEDKLCFSAVFELDDKADVVSSWIGRTVIHSNRRFTYEEAQEIIETGNGDYSEEIFVITSYSIHYTKLYDGTKPDSLYYINYDM